MKILLVAVNAKYIHSNLAVYSLKAYAKQWKAHIEIAEYTINHRREQVLKDLYERRPDVLAFSCYIWNLDFLEGILPDLPKILPGAPVFLGGPEVSYETEAFLERHPEVDGVMRGEGEETFARLCECLLDNHRQGRRLVDGLEEIPGLLLQNNFQRTGISEALPAENQKQDMNQKESMVCDGMSLDSLPFPYEELENFENRILYYESSRGCPFSCSYCLSSIEKRVRFRNLKLVFSELDFFLERKVPQVKFVDRTFNCDRKRARVIWRYIKEHDNGVTNFHFEVGADLLEEEDLELLSGFRPGCVQLEIGVQSTNLKTLKEIRRASDLEKLAANVKRIHDCRNIHQHLDLIAGLPYEDLESFEKSFNDVYEMEPDQLQLGFLKVLKGSHMYEMAENYGLLYGEKPPYEVIGTKWLSYQDILVLKGIEEMVEIYYNSGQFEMSVKTLVKEGTGAFGFFRKLSEFYQENGYDKAPSSRQAKYDLLLQFVRRYAPGQAERFKELLVYDLYSREKVKARPDWAPSQEAYKEAVRAFYQKEAVSHDYLPDYEGYNWKQLMHMCHIEVFSYPEKRAVLFDYKRREPLNHGANTSEVLL